MTELAKRFDNLFGLKAKGLADDMMRDAASSSAWALKGSLKELSAVA